MNLSVIILNYKAKDFLKVAIQSVIDTTEGIEYEIIVVDNASGDGSAEMVKEEFPPEKFPMVDLIENPENTGFAHGNNLGIKASKGEFVCLLNPDTKVLESTFEGLVKFMKETPDCGMAGPKVLFEDGSEQFSFRKFPDYKAALFSRASFLTRFFPKNKFSDDYLMASANRNKAQQVDWVYGNCMVARRSAFDEVGLLDENFFMYAEDVDWCYRMIQKGWKNYFWPGGAIIHYCEKCSSQVPYKSLYERHRSMYYYYKKHYSYHIPLIDYATLAGIIARFLSHCLLVGKGSSKSK